MVKAKINVDGGSYGNATITDQFYMWDTVMFKSAQFFSALGIEKDENGRIGSIPSRWAHGKSDLLGRTCWANIYIDEFTGNDGQKKQTNKVKSYTSVPPADQSEANARHDPRYDHGYAEKTSAPSNSSWGSMKW